MMGFNITPVVKNLLILNIAIFIITNFIPSELTDYLALRYFESSEFAPWQLFTYMFMHGGWMHLFSNMFALFMFGPHLEQVFGPKRFLTFYLVCGIGAALFHFGIMFIEVQQLKPLYNTYLKDPTFENFLAYIREYGADHPYIKEFITTYEDNATHPQAIANAKGLVKATYYNYINTPMVGASGAVFGILLGFGMLFPNMVLMLLIPPIPIKAKYFILIYGLLEFVYGVKQAPGSGDNVAHFAHLGGMLFAFILIRYWGIKSRNY
ncbi:MAG TPA: rhomboid family intramembrane serine protease [Cytophagaceae bacterium]